MCLKTMVTANKQTKQIELCKRVFFSKAFSVNHTEIYKETTLGSVIAQEQAYV